MTTLVGAKAKPITYSRSITVDLTHVCHNRCAYCGYRRPSQEVLGLGAVRQILARGQAAGCREVLVISGEKPWLEPGFPLSQGQFINLVYDTCVEALRLGLSPHTNVGVLSEEDLGRLKAVNVSMGLMLETANRTLAAHAKQPGKNIDERLDYIANAGRLRIPFTTGILIGIGESRLDRREALTAIADLHAWYGHIQEVIVQNLQPQTGTPMADWSPPSQEEMVETVRLAREILPDITIQVPPNLNEGYVSLLNVGAADLGGISPEADVVNPFHPWPAIDQISARLGSSGYALRERLPVYPELDVDLGPVADRMRQELVGDTVTYVVNCNINFTNRCVGSCRFCAYRVEADDPESYLLTVSQIVDKATQAVSEGATEVCIQGGLHPDLPLTFYAGMLRALKERFPALHTHAFSPMEVKWLSEKERISVNEVLMELKQAGLDSMPGTAAEILVDEVRQQICPDKLNTAEWVRVIKAAHRLGIPTTSTMMFGHIETWAHRIEHMQVILDIQKETGGFTEFVLLPFVPWKTGLGQDFAIKGITPEEVLRVTSYARLFFGKDLVNIQGSWVKTGVAGLQQALQAGANDFGGTLMEESISRCAGADHGERLSRDEIEMAIRQIGRNPMERDTLYNLRGDHNNRLPGSEK